MIELELIRRREQWARSFSSSGGGDVWTFGFVPAIITNSFNFIDIAFGMGMYVAIGDNYDVAYSYNAKDWFFYKVSVRLTCITFGDGKFVATGNLPYRMDWSAPVIISTNGIDWTRPIMSGGISDIVANHHYITFGNGRFIISHLTNNLPVYTSTNGIDWVSVNSIRGGWLARAGSYFYKQGNYPSAHSETDNLLYSSNGINWYPTTMPHTNRWVGVAYGNSRYVALSVSGTHRVATSTTGTGNWTPVEIPLYNWRLIYFFNGLFIAVADNKIATSSNGTTWTLKDCPTSYWKAMVHGNPPYGVNDVVVVVSNFGGNHRLMYSFNLDYWVNDDNFQPKPYNLTLSYDNVSGLFVALGTIKKPQPVVMPYVGDVDSKIILTSFDGINWSNNSIVNNTFINDNTWSGITIGHNSLGQRVVVMVANDNSSSFQRRLVYNAVYSSNSTEQTITSWSVLTTGNTKWNDVLYHRNRNNDHTFVAVGSGTNDIAYSSDGKTWTQIQSPEQNNWTSLCYGNGDFYAVSSNGTNRMMRSSFGSTWELIEIPLYNWTGITHADGTDDLFIVSTDVILKYNIVNSTWVILDKQYNASSIMYADYTLIINGRGSSGIISTDFGLTWRNFSAKAGLSNSSLRSKTVFGDDKFVTSNYDRIFYTEPETP